MRRESIQESLDKEFSVPQSLFVAEGLKLRALKPVAIRVSRGQDVWFAENERLDIYATGESKEAAIQEFRLLLVRFYCHYKSLDAQKALKRARELKQLFEERFAEVSSESRSEDCPRQVFLPRALGVTNPKITYSSTMYIMGRNQGSKRLYHTAQNTKTLAPTT